MWTVRQYAHHIIQAVSLIAVLLDISTIIVAITNTPWTYDSSPRGISNIHRLDIMKNILRNRGHIPIGKTSQFEMSQECNIDIKFREWGITLKNARDLFYSDLMGDSLSNC